ncbi:HAD-IIIC family phosphatase, partial [Cohnella sp. CFH 77786]|uniref:type I polyketide synthase n=1 Tax=Cohnella sp. CFH 77786 TaxID=2662265 RepID=UPI001C610903
MREHAWWDDAETPLAEASGPERTAGDAGIEETSGRDVAIVGMAVRLPQADDVRRFWQRVAEGFDAVGPFPETRRRDADSMLSGTRLPGRKVSYYDGAYLEEIDRFDHRFFRLSPKEAALMSPNQRLWLETAWSAIEDAGYGGRKLAGSRTGVYVGYNGDAFHDYKRLVAERDPASLSLAIPGNLSSIVAGRISYLLDLKGPALTVDTACSSSLLALHLAMQALRSGECETALVGGVKTYLLPIDMGIRIGIESPDFRARTFDEASEGTGGGEGAAAVLLKPLGRALRDRDAIYAVIKGSAANQDGASVGITAPNVLAQEEVIVQAWGDAGIDPETIGYIEAHGTGTRLGDPIEIAGITQAFRRFTDRKQFCAVGSVKTNFGHLDTAAGIVGLIKAALALHERQLPPMLHFREPNRDIPFVDSPVYVSDLLRSWPGGDGMPRRAGVSSFGMSGTNVHAVLEEAPPIGVPAAVPGEGDTAKLQVLALSARSATALGRLAESYARYLEEAGAGNAALADFCYTANTGRGHYEYRAAMAAGSVRELADKLRTLREKLDAESAAPPADAWASPRLVSGIWLGRADTSAGSAPVMGEEWLQYPPERLCRAYAEGGVWDWELLYRDAACRKIHLPAYPFDRIRCWVEEAGDASYRIPAESAQETETAADSGKAARTSVLLTGRDNGVYSATEEAVALAWGRVLGFSSLGIRDHYYELGGDSILALQIVTELTERFGREIGVADLLGHPTVADLSAYLDGSGAGTAEPDLQAEESFVSGTAKEVPEAAIVFPLSRAQLRIFLASRQTEADLRHHMTLAYVIEGPLDPERLRFTFVRLAERHESLRTTFEWTDEGVPAGRVHPFPEVELTQAQVDSEDVWPAFAEGFVRPFDLSRLPLFRAGIASAPGNRHLLLLDTHHLIADGASLALLLQEMTALYAGQALPSKKADYRDYVRLQRDMAESPEMRKQRSYWLEETLAGPLPQLRLPLDFPRPKTRTLLGGTFRFSLTAPEADALRELAKRRQVSLHTVLFSLYALLMNRYTEQEDLIVGSLVNGREQTEFRHAVGIFINFLPVRVRVREGMTFSRLLDDVGRATAEAYGNGRFPYDEMASALGAGSDRSRNPLYDTMLVFHNHAAGSERFEAGGLTFSEYPLERATSSLDVKMDVFPGAGGELHAVIEYDSGLFRESTVARLADDYRKLAAAMSEDADAEIGSVRLFEAAERSELDRRRRLNDGLPSAPERLLAVRIASSFTAEPVTGPLSKWLRRFGIAPEITFAPYNQIVQYLLAEDAEPSEAAATIALVRPDDWLAAGATASEDGLARLADDFETLFRIMRGRSDRGPQIVALLPFSENGPLGGLPEASVRTFADRIREIASAAAPVHLLDGTAMAARYRVRIVEDPVAYEEGRIPYTEDFYAAVGTEIARALIGWNGHPFKVVAVDADNTLWRGVCGEDGPLGVSVPPAFASFQRLLLRKRSEGMLLALCSKNNEADLWEVFDRHPDMLLRKEHFSAWRVNWSPKPDNVREMAEELGLGLDSFIFVDDNAAECLGMMAERPEVLTLKLPDEREIPAFLEHVWAWDRLRVTEEDRKRAAGYEAERKRQAAARSGETLEQYLRGLELKVGMRPLAPDETERAAQLTARTNQFNLNGIRLTEEDMRARSLAEGARLWMVEAADRYGDYGRIGLVSGTVQGDALVLDLFLLSCRVLGRGVEQAVCAGLKRFAEANGCTELRAEFTRTAKNRPFERFLEESGWMGASGAALPEGAGASARLSIPLSRVPEAPGHVEFYEGVRIAAEEAYGQSAPAREQRGASLTAFAAGTETETGTGTFSDGKSYDWVVPYGNEELLPHRAYLLPLRYPDASSVIALPDEGKTPRDDRGGAGAGAPYEPPAGDVEEAIAGMWTKVLGGGTYGRSDHFFDVGGDSLRAASLVSQLARAFGVRVTLVDLFDHPRLNQMAGLIEQARRTQPVASASVLARAPEAESYPVSSAQRSMYFLQRFEPEGLAYHIPTVLRLSGPLDRERLRRAFRRLAERHEALRTSFELREGDPVQIIHPAMDADIEEQETEEGETLRHALRAFVRPFDLHRAPLYRVGLFRLAEEAHVLAFDIHHIVADGVSVNVLMDDFLALYADRGLPPLDLQYKDYAVWQKAEKEAGRFEESLGSWLRRFEKGVPKLELPADRPRPAIKSSAGAQLILRVDRERTDGLNRLGRQSDATLFMVLLAAYATWLMKLTRQTDLVVGTPVAGRSRPETARMVGVFVNPLPLRLQADPDFTFDQLLGAVKSEVLSALGRQETPFGELVERLQPDRDASRNPLFDAMFSMLNMEHADLSAAEISVRPEPFDFGVSQFDVGLSALEEEGGLTLTIQYAADIYAAETVKRWAEAFGSLIRGIVRDPSARLADLEWMTDEERRQVVEGFNYTEAPYPEQLTLPAMFRQQAERTPDRVAAAFAEETLTYRELDERSGRIARALREGGLAPEEPVGLMA